MQTFWCLLVASFLMAGIIVANYLMWPHFGLGSIFICILVIFVTCMIAIALEEAGFAGKDRDG